MKARCRLRSGAKIELRVLDISPIGCMIERRGWTPRLDERLLVQLEGLGFQPARLVWVDDDHAGIEFEQMLHEAVLGQLKESIARAA